MSNIIIDPTSDEEVIRIGERVQRISSAKSLWYAAVERYQMQGMNPSRAYQTALQTLVVNGFRDVARDAMNEVVAENTPA